MPARCPWEALPLVAPFLDAASLAAASCVSTSWHAAFAADHLWARLCVQHFPSALGLLPDTDSSAAAGSDDDRRCSSSPHRRLFKLFRSASIRCRALPAPRLALADVSFAVDIVTAGGESTLSFLVAADRAAHAKNSAGLFLFGVDLSDRSAAIGPGEWRVRWTAVRMTARRGADQEPAAAVLMMDTKVPAARAAGAVAFGGRGEAGVAARVPAPGCGGAKLDAEVVVELAGEEMVVEKVRLGVMCECRCTCGLRSANFSSRVPVLVNLITTRDRMRATYSRRAASKNSEVKKDEQPVIEKEDAAESDLEIERVRSNPSQLQSMTVKELRELTRRMGVSVKGTKKDLVSALMNSLGEEGKSSIELVSPSEVPLKRKGGASAVVEQKLESSEIISETPSKKRSRTKQKSNKSTTLEENSFTNVKLSKTVVQKEIFVVQGAVPNDDSEPWTVLVHKKPQAGWIPYNPKTMRPPPLSKDTRALKIMSWNVNGLKALLKSRGFSVQKLAQREDFDVLCLQETKMQEKDVEVIKDTLLDGYTNSFFTCSVSKLGYSGTAIISRAKPLSIKYGLGIPDHDTEGRVVTVEFDDFYLLTAYVPNSGDGLKRLTYRVTEWDPSLGNYMKELEKSKPVILTGDLNCAHQEIDIHDPAGNRKSAGFTNEERESFETNFLSKGFVDTFRKQHPSVVAYSYWGYRHNARKTNKGWRLDYFLVSESIAEKVHDSYILPDISASDHSPLGLVLKL
ncbi:DNA-(apurinic or apyrimidinic site) endonuclease, chloroplastic-like [Miscanthus floridulus]|uniref:DNA-(apurinic or apyrimidinic site) endonuclease, chloroplastic-like n=1 Tax=Miscanthus floridulus TaxID=154761 RepID=UPI003459B573